MLNTLKNSTCSKSTSFLQALGLSTLLTISGCSDKVANITEENVGKTIDLKSSKEVSCSEKMKSLLSELNIQDAECYIGNFENDKENKFEYTKTHGGFLISKK